MRHPETSPPTPGADRPALARSARLGRAFTPGLTEAFITAAAAWMARDGLTSMTVTALATEVGTTRPTFYRRFASIEHLALDVIRARQRPSPAPHTGSLREDLLTLLLDRVEFYCDPVVARGLVDLLATAQRDPGLAERIHVQLIVPARRAVADVLGAAAARGEVDVDLAGAEGAALLHLVCDVLEGPLLARTVCPGVGLPDAVLARRTVLAALRLLDRQPA